MLCYTICVTDKTVEQPLCTQQLRPSVLVWDGNVSSSNVHTCTCMRAIIEYEYAVRECSNVLPV